MSSPYCLVFSTCPEAETANRLAHLLVEQRLAACVNLLPGITSCYRWQGAVETASEVLLMAKTATHRYGEVERAIRQHHPYELPEIVMVPIGHGLPPYLQWIAQCVEPETSSHSS
ncbi:MAG: divalent-cation tolerance protein CutA [Methylococcaceae bacterium]|nr:divalent-cation tolerance protein CutA [Methylococcaceae bacterium]